MLHIMLATRTNIKIQLFQKIEILI